MKRKAYRSMPILTATVLLTIGGPACAQTTASTAPSKVTITHQGEAWQLQVNGKPFFVKGAGGSASMEKLKATGGNSLRTWGADNLEPILADAHRLGMMITVGIWLGHKEHGFDYNNAEQVAEQYERVRQTVNKYKNDPAILSWALGNEMEGYEKGDNAAVWSAIESAAALVKKIDPNHPTMTVIAEIGGDRVKNIERLCPDIDIIGINSYGGAPSLPQRYKEAGGTKPYILTEFGPPGTWEGPKTSWGAPIELTSTAKADTYRAVYEKAVANQPLCLGSYAFTWGNKQEATATWYGLLLPNGNKLGGVDALHQMWTNTPPATPCPVIRSMALDGSDQIDPGKTIKATLDASDPAGKPLNVRWVLQAEHPQKNMNGDTEPVPPTYPEAITHSDAHSAEIHLPTVNGPYRLFAYVEDGAGGAAVANVPLLIGNRNEASADTGTDAPKKTSPAATAKLPLDLFPKSGNAPFIPAGWMGDAGAIQMDEKYGTNPHSGTRCMQFKYDKSSGWGGVVWQSPVNDWGDKPGGFNLSGAKKLTFWARGDNGGEVVSFQIGLIKSDKKYYDTAQAKLTDVNLTKDWKQYTLDLNGKDLSRVKTGFCWIVAAKGAPVTFYLDDLRYE